MSKRDLTILLLAFAAAIGLSAWIFLSSAMETGSWGLSFRQEGAPPIGTAGADQLRAYDAAYLGNTGEKVLYLTFDAGYENGCTASILDTLKKHEVKAVFFLVGNYLEKNADLVRRMVDEGHTVGNHTMHHYNMSAISDPAAGKPPGRNFPKTTVRRRASTVRKISARQRHWGTGPFSGVLPMWTGTTTPSPRRNRPSPSSCPGPIPAPWSCSTPPPKPTPPSWMNC